MASSKPLTEWVCEGRLDARKSAEKQFISRNRPEPLSPLWEAFIEGWWRPCCLQFLANPQHPHMEASLLDKLNCDVQYHAFNMSDANVNINRANIFVAELMGAHYEHYGPRNAPLPWWPRDSSAMLEAIEQERRDIDGLGYIRSAASRRSEEQVSDNKDIEGQEGETTEKLERRRGDSDCLSSA